MLNCAGFEPRGQDIVYWIKRERDGYERLGAETMALLKSGKARL